MSLAYWDGDVLEATPEHIRIRDILRKMKGDLLARLMKEVVDELF